MEDQYKEINSLYGSRTGEFGLLIPSNFRILCALLQVKPEKVLQDFMWTVSQSHHNATDAQREKAIGYFLECAYGRELYKEEDILTMFKELEAQRILWINDIQKNPDTFQHHIRWQHMYIEYWFRKWFYKCPRECGIEMLEEY